MRLSTIKLLFVAQPKLTRVSPWNITYQLKCSAMGPACVCVAEGLADVSATLYDMVLGLSVSACGDRWQLRPKGNGAGNRRNPAWPWGGRMVSCLPCAMVRGAWTKAGSACWPIYPAQGLLPLSFRQGWGGRCLCTLLEKPIWDRQGELGKPDFPAETNGQSWRCSNQKEAN